jgi:hypothetical protein
MRSTKGKKNRVYENQTTEVYGGGFTLVDLNLDEPIPNPDWLRIKLIAEDVECEYPACDAYAITVLKIPKHYPYLCNEHHALCTGDLGPWARRALRDALVDEILETSFGLMRTPRDAIKAKPLVLTQQRIPATLFVSPEFGQL